MIKLNEKKKKLKEDSYDGIFEKASLMIEWVNNTSEKDFRIFRVLDEIPKEAVFHEYTGEFKPGFLGQQIPIDTKGIEYTSHITVGAYMESSEFPKVEKIIELLSQQLTFEFELGPITTFRHEESENDVLKFSVISPSLEILNKTIRDNGLRIAKNWDYTPHLTLSYIQKGTLMDWEDRVIPGLTGETFKIHEFSFILPNKQKITIRPDSFKKKEKSY
jgi:hypothetical protein